MSFLNRAGTALSAPCLASLLVLTACQSQSVATSPDPNHSQAAQDDLREMHNNLEALKQNPSLQPGSSQAGAPVHVNPYPQSKGMTHGDMGGMSHDEHPTNSTDEH